MLQESDFPTWFKNSVIVTTVAVVSQLLLCPLAGYAFARMRFIGTRTLQLLLLTTVFIPPQLLMIPVYKMYAALRHRRHAAVAVPALDGVARSASS